MTAKENMKKIFRHEKPDWIAHLGSEAYGIRDYIVERPIMTTGYDAWGALDQLSGFAEYHASGHQ